MGNMCFSCLTMAEERGSDYCSHKWDRGNNRGDVNTGRTENLKAVTDAATRGDDVTLRDLIQKGAIVNNTDRHGQTAIFYVSLVDFINV